MVIVGYLWLLLVIQWLSLVSSGYCWLPLVIVGYTWFPVVILGFQWLLLVTFGYCWLSLLNWLLLVFSGYCSEEQQRVLLPTTRVHYIVS